MKTKIFTFIVVLCAVFFATQKLAIADTLPMAGVDILIKSIASRLVVVANTDNNGNFTAPVKENNGAYNVFVGDESFPPVKIMAQNGIVGGRLVILTGGTVTKDPAPVPTPVKKPVQVKKSKPVTKTTK